MKKLVVLIVLLIAIAGGSYTAWPTVSDTWSTWSATPASNSPASSTTPEIDAELRNIKGQVKGNVADLVGNQTIAGIKTFSSFPVTPSSAPTTNYQVSNKKYVDDADNTLQGNINTLSSTVVTLTGDQTVAGIKTFSSFPVTPSSAPTTNYQTANKKYVDDQIGAITIQAFPVGAVYRNTTGTNPGTELGYGTWQEVEPDIFLSNLRLLLPWGGTTGDKPTPALTGQTVTYTGGAAVSTAALKYGVASLLLDGDGDYVSLTDGSHWQFGTADFAISLHVKLISIQQSNTTVTIRNTLVSIGSCDNADGLQIAYASDGGSNNKLRVSSYGTLFIASSADVLSDFAWHEVLVTRLNSQIYLFLDGALVGSALCAEDFATARNLYLGVDPNYIAANRDLNGYIGRVRIYNGAGCGPGTWPGVKQYHWKRTS